MSTDIHIGLINLQTNIEQAKELKLTHINLTPDFQRLYEAWTEKLKTRLIESILLGRAMNPIWTVNNSADACIDVLDGMHRLKTALGYFNNEFALGISLCSLNPDNYKNKCFKDLSEDDKNKIRNYKFIFNHLDSSYRNDRNKLMDMYEILNASSKPLNDHELRKPIYKPFYDILAVNDARWFKTPLFTKDKITRGDLYKVLTNIIALSEERIPSSFSSLNDIGSKWEDNNLGDNVDSVTEYIHNNENICKERLDRLKKYMDRFIQENLFPVDQKYDQMIAQLIIARCVAIIKRENVFGRHSANLIDKFKTEIMDGNIQTKLNCSSRNAMFQKSLIAKIDQIIRTEIGEVEEPRLFSKAVILATLEKQKFKCAHCSLLINKQQKYEGDHIIPWSQMGATTPENCQVLHQKCHKLKC